MVSTRNADGLRRWIADAAHEPWVAGVRVHERLEAVSEDPSVVAAVVANLPAEHHASALRMLGAGKHVLVEKPLAPTAAEAAELVHEADRRDLVLAVDHEFLYARHVRHLAALLSRRGLDAGRITVTWHDPLEELRWGELKRADVTTDVVTDVYPHVLTLLTVLAGRAEPSRVSVHCSGGGSAAELSLTYGSWHVSVSLSRVAKTPCREIVVTATSGAEVRLDFTTEPGSLYEDGVAVALDPGGIRPLDAVAAAFLSEITSRTGASPVLASQNLSVVAATEEAARQVVRAQASQLETVVMQHETDPAADDLVALRQHLAVPLLRAGLVASPKDDAALLEWTATALALVRRLAHDPFASQADLGRELGLDRATLAALGSAIRHSELAQRLILHGGTAKKYWVNTVVPLMASGAVDAALRGEPRYPFRVGIYPGLSCMFSCTFCGRNRDAVYPRRTITESQQVFTDIFETAPTDDPHRFYVSGGLEPLTNPCLGDIISKGAERGFRLSMYTNGFLLTEGLIARRPGLWDLDSLRISVYGPNERSARSVTQRDGSFTKVMQNVGEFLRLREERGASLKVGFNFVVLPGRATEVLQLADVVADLNRQAPGGRGLDFLTLREDYSAAGEDGIQPEERAQLVDVIGRLDDRRRSGELGALEIDYGYALHAATKGCAGRPLQMVSDSAMRPAGYPQISVVVDPFGDVYLYREAGFLDRPGADRYIIGRTGPDRPFEQVVADFVRSGRTIPPHPGDTAFFDIFDHVVTLLLNQADSDAEIGIPFDRGPVRDRRAGVGSSSGTRRTLAHPTLSGEV
jgi:dTDP-4-amino-4,6-dideoxy-D-glucose ammonia-lyase